MKARENRRDGNGESKITNDRIYYFSRLYIVRHDVSKMSNDKSERKKTKEGNSYNDRTGKWEKSNTQNC
jgi:hypothetical protein